METSASESRDAGAHGRLWAAATGLVRYHLTPLALIELTAFGAAMLAGWNEVAIAILAFHVARMVVTAIGGDGHGLSHGLGLSHGHGLSHWLGHGDGHGLGHGEGGGRDRPWWRRLLGHGH